MSVDVQPSLARARSLVAKAEEYSILLFVGFVAVFPYAIQFLGLSLTFAVEIVVFLLTATAYTCSTGTPGCSPLATPPSSVAAPT